MNQLHPLPFERLAWIDDPVPRDAALNMALDEVLLEGLGHDPVLRVYRWERPAVSIGCFEPFEPVIRRWPGHNLVRRWTGGGIVEHGHDLTFTLLVPRFWPLGTLSAGESYRAIHAAVATAIARAGHAGAMLQAAAATVKGASRACFENPVPHDLLLMGRKIAGGAQRRTRRGLLHQGSIQNTAAVGGKWFDAESLDVLAEALPRAFGTVVESCGMTTAVVDAARALAATKYGTTAWLRRF